MQLHPSIPAAEDSASSHASPGRVRQETSPLRRRLLWSGGIVALILLLVFLPPLVNANHYQRQIARSMSASLGRPVHLDNVTLHLLPVPGLTLSNLVVSEDPAFGDEPTIRANSVEATLRLGSLWRRRVEFSTIRFIEPSVNLVRNEAGRWNFANVLLHASRVETAPTVQRRAGPAPRFPYIEATGGRLNIKLGREKLPFSLTDADFALWLPSTNQWQVRLRGQPARTDTNINEPGTFRLEGDLRRNGVNGEVPVDLHATWHDAPLGEASRLITGNDLGWRGSLNLDATLAGTLNGAQVRTQLTLGGLRRAEFAAAHPLDLQVSCGADLTAVMASLTRLRCSMPDSAPGPMVLEAATLDIAHPAASAATLTGEAIPTHWALLWAALFSPRVPTDTQTAGTLDLTVQHVPPGAALAAPVVEVTKRGRRGWRGRGEGAGASTSPVWNQWTGVLRLHLPAPEAASATETGVKLVSTAEGPRTELVWRLAPNLPAGTAVAAGADGLAAILQPVTIPLGGNASVNVMAVVSSSGYTVTVAGAAPPAALLLPARYLPQLGDGLEGVLSFPPTGLEAQRVEFTCNHPWGSPQSCTSLLRPAPGKGAPASVPGGQTLFPATPPARSNVRPSVTLMPRSLSPFDRDPQLGAEPQPASGSPRL